MRPPESSPFPVYRTMTFSLVILVINIVLFGVTWIVAGSLNGPGWTTTLLRLGAQFNPLTLDREWFRMLTHVFLHGSLLHLLVNSYALAYLGFTIETKVGAKKFAFAYLLSALAATICSLNWNLFTIQVGSSGAIAGLFGLGLVYDIFFSGKSGKPMVILLIHFALFAGLHLGVPDAMHADYAAMYGGVIMGIMIGFLSFARGAADIRRIRIEYVLALVLLILFLLVPGYQVRYFKFFQQMVAAEDTTRHLVKEKLTDDDMRTFIRNYHHWEEILARLDNQRSLPGDLAADTFRLRKYIALRKQENLLKKLVVQREAYVYLDSVDRLQQVMRRYMDLDYKLWSRIKSSVAPDSAESGSVTIYYDADGREVQGPGGAYHRRVVKDSLGRWDGHFREFDEAGRLRIKGNYRKNKRDGVFLFYSANGNCREAGRYLDDKKFGKWQTFHDNGRIASETFYNSGYFVNSVWDSLGNQLVVDGNGREIQVYPDDVVKVDGEYRHGVKEGTWYGRYSGGEMHYEEVYSGGQLISGKSRSPSGETFVYDASSLHPIPEGGYGKFEEYVKGEIRRFDAGEFGHVKLSFRVTRKGYVADLAVQQSASSALDAKAKEIILDGPRWLPARMHGYDPIDEWVNMQVDFY